MRKKCDLKNKRITPGSGAYNHTEFFTKPIVGSKIGTSTRDEKKRLNSPGPGAYNSTTTISHGVLT